MIGGSEQLPINNKKAHVFLLLETITLEIMNIELSDIDQK